LIRMTLFAWIAILFWRYKPKSCLLLTINYSVREDTVQGCTLHYNTKISIL